MQPRTASPPHDTVPVWRLELLGGANLRGLALRHSLERKTAGVLALLAFEGEVSRSKVAGLLWADTDEERARANLRQCLHRLKKLTGTELVRSGERLTLSADLEIDTVNLESRAFLGDDAGLIAVRGEILEQIDFDDCLDFSEWLNIQRQRWRTARVGAYRRVIQNHSSAQALDWAQEWVNLEPLSEEASRTLARVYHQRGNRALALHTLRDLEARLKQELGGTVSSDTRALRQSLERDEPELQPAPISLPQTVLNPSQLVGREREWALLEQAWNAGMAIVVRGEPGVGKTRLMLEFLASKTRFDLIEARPGDANVPMSAYARTLRQLMASNTSLELPSWAKLELSRVNPELSDVAPAPMTSEADKLRFFEALFTVTEWRFRQGVQAIMIDDLQFMDAASFEAAQFNTARTQQLGVRTISAYRKGELLPELETQIERAAASGLIQIVDVQPLEPAAMAELMRNLRLEMPEQLAARVQASTGGNPLYTLETVRDLLEQEALHGEIKSLPIPKVVKQITAQRLERRSALAQRLAQVAAVSGTDFTLELGAFVLESKTFDLHDALTELEEAQFLRGERFAHDLLLEAVLDGISLGVKRFLHRKIAEYLETRGDPARVAQHWIDGGDDLKAVPSLIQAGQNSKKQFRVIEASALFRQAGQVLEKLRQYPEAFQAYNDARDTLYTHDLGDDIDQIVQDMRRNAKTLSERVTVAHVQAELLIGRGEFEKAIIVVEHGVQLAQDLGNQLQLGNLEGDLGEIYFYQGKIQLAVKHFQNAVDHAELHLKEIEGTANELHLSEAEAMLAISSANLALALENIGNYQEAEQRHRQAIVVLRHYTDHRQLFAGLPNLAINLMDQGRFREARVVIEEALEMLEFQDDTGGLHTVGLYTNATDVYIGLDEPMLALNMAKKAVAKAETLNDPRIPLCLSRLAQAWCLLGETGNAKQTFEQTTTSLQTGSVFSLSPMRMYASFLHDLGEDTQSLQAELESALESGKSLVKTLLVQLLFAYLKAPRERHEFAQKTLEQALEYDMNGIVIGAHSRLAAALLDLHHPEQALEHTNRAMTLLEQFDSEIPRAEVLYTHHRALIANKKTKEAAVHLKTTLQWLEGVAQRISPEYRVGFLHVNPINHAILEMAKLERV